MRKRISFEVQNEPVRTVLRTIFKEVGVSYSLHPDVQGNVTLKIANVEFEMALQKVLQLVDATYRSGGGVISIVPRQPSLPESPDDRVQVAILDLEVAEAIKRLPTDLIVEVTPGVSGTVNVVGDWSIPDAVEEIARQTDSRAVPVESGWRLVPKNSLQKPIEPIKRQDTDLRKLVEELMEKAEVDYVISGGIVGKTTLNLRSADLRTALEAILKPIGGKITLVRGVFVVSAR